MAIRDAEYGRQGWYPYTANECEAEIARCTEGWPVDATGTLHGGIAPHAGWHFSGRITGGVFRALANQAPDTVVVFGHHMSPGARTTVMADGGWRTPLGDLTTDQELVAETGEDAESRFVSASKFQTDNTIELQLPFVKHFFPRARIVAVGAAPSRSGLELADRVADAAGRLGRRIVALGSTDLTHYGPNYGFSPHGKGEEARRWVTERNDPGAINRMLALDPEGLIEEAFEHQNACCPGAAAAAMRTALALGATAARKVGYATSADVMPSSSFVGYVGVVF